jgi:hypothetical protein
MTEMPWQAVSAGSFLWAAAGDPMDHFWTKLDLEWLVLVVAGLAVLVAVAAFVFAKIRSKSAKKEPLASQWLSKYGELHSRGGLSDEEFRTIKTKLAEQLQDELNDNGENG